MSDASDRPDDGTDAPPPGDGAPGADRPDYSTPREDEVSLLDILLVLARHKTLIVRTVLAFTLLGVTYALLASEQYTSEAKVIRESESTGGGNLPGGISALQGLGISLGGAASGLTPAAYPEILESRAVQLAVAQDTFRFPDEDRRMTFVEYVDRPPGILSQALRYTVWLPWTLKGMLGSAISGETTRPVDTGAGKEMYPSKAEEKAMSAVGGRVGSSINQENGFMTIRVTAGDPVLAADLTESFLYHLKERVRTIRTQKSEENLEFIEQRFEEAEQELQVAEERLAQFTDRNQNIQSAQLRTERERLQRQVSFASDLYSELQTQLTQARIELQRSEPVITVVEEPAPPLNRSAPQRTLIVILSVFLGGLLGVGGAFVSNFFSGKKESVEEQKKVEKIQTAFFPRSLAEEYRKIVEKITS
jgi:uncharacterized protein involved in exopolysaccharide biosynthesis